MEVLNNALRDKIRDLEQEIKETTGLLDQAKVKIQESKSEKSKLEEEMNFKLKDLQSKVNDMTMKEFKLTAKITKIDREHAEQLRSTKERLRDMINQRDEIKLKLLNKQNEYNKIDMEKETQKKEIESLKSLCVKKQEEINSFDQYKEKISQDIRRKNEVICKNEEIAKQLNHEINVSKASIEKFKLEITQQETKLRSTKEHYEKRISDMGFDKEELEKWRRYGREIEGELETEEEEEDSDLSDEESTDLPNEIKQIQAKLATMKQDFDKTKKENSSLKGVLTKEKKKTKEIDEKIYYIWSKMEDSGLGLNHSLI